jgi:hypothetical protein
MRTRLRLGAATVVALGALLLATALASPAFAWHSTVKVNAFCLDSGEVRVRYTVSSWKAGHPATVAVSYRVNDGESVDRPGGEFTETKSEFTDSFELPEGTTGTVTVTAKATWENYDHPTENQASDTLPKKCKHEDTTTSSSVEETTTTSDQEETTTTSDEEETTTTSGEEETTTSEVLGESSTTGGGALPFTGASSGPMLLAGLGLVGGGLLFLWSSRTRNQPSR